MQLTITICIICQLKSQGSLGRGTQRRFPSKYVENTFQAIQSSFRSQEKHSRRRYKIGSCSVTLGDFASFTCRNYKGFRIIFPKILDAIYPFKKNGNFSDSSLNHIFESKRFRSRFSTKNSRKTALLACVAREFAEKSWDESKKKKAWRGRERGKTVSSSPLPLLFLSFFFLLPL